MRRTIGLALVALLAACGGGGRSPADVASSAVTTSTTPTTTTTTTTATTTTAPTAPTSTTVTTPTEPPAPAEPEALPDDVAFVSADELGASWHEGCPVGPDSLRALTVAYWGFDGSAHVGRLVVHETVVDAMRSVFQQLYAAQFPIRKVVPISAYGASDELSTADDNTSAFNCREAVRSDGVHAWSHHAYGWAIDVNPVENPYIEGGRVLPPNGADYVDRSVERPGMAIPGNPLNNAFASVGWGWGGTWSAPDYQHFSKTGR